MRLIFMGTPDFAVETLKALIAADHEIACVYSQPPKPAGRGLALKPTPVHAFAQTQDFEVRTPASLKAADEQSRFAALGAEAAIVVAYGLLLPKAILDAPMLGCFNVHASLLPRWRGAAPIQRAIMAGDAETAVMVMRMAEGLDTGPVCLAEPVAIAPDATAGELHDELALRGASLMARALGALERGLLQCTPQPVKGASYAAKIDKVEACIDFAKPAREVHNLIRGLSPFPGAWFEMGGEGAPERIKALRAELADGRGRPGEVLDDVLTIACGSGAVRLTELQRAGKKPMRAEEFLRGFPLPRGTILQP